MSWTTKSTQKSKLEIVEFLSLVLQRFRQFWSEFFSSHPPYFRLGQSSLFTCCCKRGHFLRVGFNLPWVSFCQSLSKTSGWFFYIKIFYGDPFCIGGALNFQLPAVALRVSMTMCWPAMTTQKSKMICVQFLDWGVQWFRHFSSDFFSKILQFFLVPVNCLYLFAVSTAFAFIGIVFICQEYLFVIVFVISSNIFLTKHIWRSEISNDEGLQFQLPAVVLGVSMTIWWRTKSTQKSKMQLVDFICWVVQRFRHFSSDFSSSLPPYFPGQSSLFTCCCESGHFHCVGLNFPWVSFFVNVCPKFPDDFFIYNYFMKIPFFCIGEALNLLMPAVALRVSMTMSWPTKPTQESKTIYVDVLDWVVQWFRRFFFNHPCLLAVPKANYFSVLF